MSSTLHVYLLVFFVHFVQANFWTNCTFIVGLNPDRDYAVNIYIVAVDTKRRLRSGLNIKRTCYMRSINQHDSNDTKITQCYNVSFKDRILSKNPANVTLRNENVDCYLQLMYTNPQSHLCEYTFNELQTPKLNQLKRRREDHGSCKIFGYLTKGNSTIKVQRLTEESIILQPLITKVLSVKLIMSSECSKENNDKYFWCLLNQHLRKYVVGNILYCKTDSHRDIGITQRVSQIPYIGESHHRSLRAITVEPPNQPVKRQRMITVADANTRKLHGNTLEFSPCIRLNIICACIWNKNTSLELEWYTVHSKIATLISNNSDTVSKVLNLQLLAYHNNTMLHLKCLDLNDINQYRIKQIVFKQNETDKICKTSTIVPRSKIFSTSTDSTEITSQTGTVHTDTLSTEKMTTQITKTNITITTNDQVRKVVDDKFRIIVAVICIVAILSLISTILVILMYRRKTNLQRNASTAMTSSNTSAKETEDVASELQLQPSESLRRPIPTPGSTGIPNEYQPLGPQRIDKMDNNEDNIYNVVYDHLPLHKRFRPAVMLR